MEPLSMEIEGSQQLSADPLQFARSYQLEALEKAIKQNTIVFLETGSGKTLIAIMLLRSYAYLLRKPSSSIAVFLVPSVVLVRQQAEAIKLHTDLNVGMYWGEMKPDLWDADMWKEEIDNHEVLVMTHQILLNNLRRSFFKLSMIKVLIFDECHHARGKHPYACIMKEFYHHHLRFGESDLPRVFGMTASLIKSKGGVTESSYWKKISELENLMHSKVYTCASESVLAEFISFSTPKFKFYMHKEVPYELYAHLTHQLKILKKKHELSLGKLDLEKSAVESISKKIMKVLWALVFCLDELGIWLALKAALSFSCSEIDFYPWEKLDVFGEQVVRHYSLDAFHLFTTFMPTDSNWTIGDDVKTDMDVGLITTKVVCLIESLLEYSNLKDLRCIVFVERVITAIVLQSLLSELLPKHNNWKTKFIAGNNRGLQYQTRKSQNEIVEEFRRGMVNVIVATSILEEGLDVQSCNLVIRFDSSSTVSSFIQSRGRARMQNSDYILMVKSGDHTTHSRLKKYLCSSDIMRKESLSHASLPCSAVESDLHDGDIYCVESTGAIVTLSSSVELLYFYCSRLPSDEYFKPTPNWDIETCTLHLPKSCPLPPVCVQGNVKNLKQIACLEACKKLHQIGALTDNLVPVKEEEADAEEYGKQPYNDEQPSYVPIEMVRPFCPNDALILYHCYIIELKQYFEYEIPVHDIVLCMRSELDSDIGSMSFDLQVDRGNLSVNFKYVGIMHLSPKQVMLCRRFQVTLFRLLLDDNIKKLREDLDGLELGINLEIDCLLLPATSMDQRPVVIDWGSVNSVLFSCEEFCKDHINCSSPKALHTTDGFLCTCMLKNSLVYTPHNDHIYFITGILNDLNGNSPLKLSDGRIMTYKKYFEERHDISLWFDKDPLLRGRKIFKVQNCLMRCRHQKEKEPSSTSVELPPELCSIIMSPISLSTFYSFSFLPSIMHRLESLLIAVNLKRMLMDHCMQNDIIPTIKVLEAITTKKCQEEFHLESLETLGDSFLKYAASQQLFKTYQNQHEGFLSAKKDKIIANATLCKLGCDHNLTGFIRNDPFDPKKWFIPGDNSASKSFEEECLFNMTKIYVSGRRKVRRKCVADVVEALIGVFLSTGGEIAALKFMDWIGIKVDVAHTPYERHFLVHAEKYVNIRQLESQLNYSFNDPSLLVEALTHGSYMLPQIPRCYQRLEFLGDAILDYLITIHLYNENPGLSPGLLTDMRSSQVNNDCYAHSAVKVGLHKHILHLSHLLHKQITLTVNNFENLPVESTFGWESEISFPKVLGDVVESMAGAIFVDSGYNKEIVFQSIRPLLEPLVTPQTVKHHPVKELNELCQQRHYDFKKPVKSCEQGVTSITIEVEANGVTYKHTAKSSDKKMAKKLACKEVLKSLKEASFN